MFIPQFEQKLKIKTMKRIRNFLIFLVIVAVGLFISKPSQKAHQDKIIEKFKKENPISGQFGLGDYFTKLISYHDYYFYSISENTVTGKPISFGIAGFVIVFGSTDLNELKDKYKDLLPV